MSDEARHTLNRWLVGSDLFTDGQPPTPSNLETTLPVPLDIACQCHGVSEHRNFPMVPPMKQPVKIHRQRNLGSKL